MEKPLEEVAEQIGAFFLTYWKQLPFFEIFPALDFTPGKRTRGCCPFCGATRHHYVVFLSGRTIPLEELLAECRKCSGQDPHCGACGRERGTASMAVQCLNCHGRGPGGEGKAEAWSAWNGGSE